MANLPPLPTGPQVERGDVYYRVRGNRIVVGAMTRHGFSLLPVLLTLGLVAFIVFLYLDPTPKSPETPALMGLVCVVTVLLAAWSVYALFGRVEIVLHGNAGHVFSGVWFLGSRERFLLNHVKDISHSIRDDSDGRTEKVVIYFHRREMFSFGESLPSGRIQFLVRTMKAICASDPRRH